MDGKIEKDNLTDLVSDLTKPANKKPSTKKPAKDLNDYQVLTPEGETITLNRTSVQKNADISEILTTENGKYILIIKK